MPTFKVFVSSTYIDLKDHRQAVIDNLLRLKLQPVAMEFFGAEPAEPKQVCDSEIEDCDLFVGIYAHRYGFTSEESEKSITEQEFDLARELGKPSFCYLIDEDHPWPPKFIEDEPGKSRLRAFKARIESALVRDTFATSQELAGKVASDLGKWLAEHGAPISSTPTIYHNLPQPDYGTFVGREAELARIRELLSPDSRHFLVTVDGIGGIGKSALALETAYRYLREYDKLPEEEQFEAIIWTSAKSSVLTADGIAPRQQITRTLDDIYTTIAVTLEREDITRARPQEQDELVTKALTQQRTLLIVDNLETVDDERVNAFLRELPVPTKAIVTTRHRVDVAYPIRLMGMPKEDGLALISQECAKKGVTLNEAEAVKLYDRTGGVPLAMVWSVAQMGYGYSVEPVLHRLGQPSEDIARYCFEGAMEYIRGKPAHKLLMALSLFAADASREVLGYVADLPELDQDEGLVVLEKLSLLNRQAGRFSLLPLTRSYLVHELERTPQFDQVAFERLLAHYKQFVAPPPEAQKTGIAYWDGLMNYARAESLEQEWGNLVHVILLALNKGRYDAALDLFLPIVHFLHIGGFWDERLRLSYEMCQAARELGDPVEVWLWIDAIGYILHHRKQLPECMQALNTGRALARQFDLDDALLLADTYEASLDGRMGDTNLARKKIDCVLKQVDVDLVLECGTPIRRIVARRVVNVAASLIRTRKNPDRKRELYEAELSLRNSIGENPAPLLADLASVSLKRNDIASAEKFLSQASDSAGPKDEAKINYVRARVAEKKGDLQEAWLLAQRALKQFIRLGGRGVPGCQKLLRRLEKKLAASTDNLREV